MLTKIRRQQTCVYVFFKNSLVEIKLFQDSIDNLALCRDQTLLNLLNCTITTFFKGTRTSLSRDTAVHATWQSNTTVFGNFDPMVFCAGCNFDAERNDPLSNHTLHITLSISKIKARFVLPN